jgi:hypothetical protein
VHAAVAHVHTIDDGVTQRTAALDDATTHGARIASPRADATGLSAAVEFAFDEGPFQNDSGVPQGPTGVFAARSPSKSHLLQEVCAMTWSDSPWVLMYSILVTLLIVLWACVPA